MPNNFLDLEGLKLYTTKLFNKIKNQASGVLSFNGRTGNITPQEGDYTASMVGAVPTSRTVNNKALSSNISLTASDVGALPITGGTLTGNLTIKGSGNYGTQINLGDSDYVHFKEPTDDCLEIKAKMVNFLLGDTTDSKFTINGTNPFGGSSGGNIELITWAGSGSKYNSIYYTHDGTPVMIIVTGTTQGTSGNGNTYLFSATLSSSEKSFIGAIHIQNATQVNGYYSSLTLDSSNKKLTDNGYGGYLNLNNYSYSCILLFA